MYVQGTVTSPVNPLRVLVPKKGVESGYDAMESPLHVSRSLAAIVLDVPVVTHISAGGTHTLALLREPMS
jgi:hypothetical protein